jgi:hypothetical protein
MKADMPVQKFRSVEEMSRAPVERARPSTFQAFLRHCARYRRLGLAAYPRGVFKFRTLEEAQAARTAAKR